MTGHAFILQAIGSGCSQPSTYAWKCTCGGEGANPYVTAEQAEMAYGRDHAQNTST